jgi:hypothetical protein
MLIENISRPVPNVAHLLLSYDVDNRVEHTKLQPKFYYRLAMLLQAFIYLARSLFWSGIELLLLDV